MLALLVEIQYLEALLQLVVRLGVIQVLPEVLARVALTIVVLLFKEVLELPDKEITAALVHPITSLVVAVVAQALSVEEALAMLMALAVRATTAVEVAQVCVLPLQGKEFFTLVVVEVALLQTWLSHLVLMVAVAVAEMEILKVLVALEKRIQVAVAVQVMR
jgi:hypothetical protein